MERDHHKLLQDESEDALLARIQEESLRYFNEVELPRRAAEQKEKEKKKEEISHKFDDLEPQPHCSRNVIYSQGDEASSSTPVSEVFYRAAGEGADGFHLAAGETYVYPTNYPIRQYQKTIIHSALFHNTLVSLPTGLGKTFIAAVVMYNFYRWFPQGKIVFMAPTRPLVAQQIRACHDIMAIPIKDTIEMTGAMNPTDRLQQWKSKRVFFLTPQVMANDLRTKACPPSCGAAFKCVVIDEAHRATKEYSYCHVIKELESAGAIFRVVALSATPGSNIKAVVEVVQNLRISTLELRGEDSPDVVPYTHAKLVEPVSLPLSRNIIEFREQYLLTFERYARSLRESRLITCNVQNLTKFQLLKASEKIRSRPPSGMSKARVGALMSDFVVCMTLAHGLELLQAYGLRAFYQYFTACEEEENRKAAFTRLNVDEDFRSLMEKLQKAVSSPMDQFWSHPKHEHLVKILKDHFCQAEKQGTDTKVIIFCQYRVVVSELFELLQTTHPLIKPVMFIGQGVGKDKSGLPQKKQIEVMKGFRQGVSNVLIATCVAEEGLDIGSVDLLVMMECQRSPVRLVQRLGRTGRHRQGRCVVLLTAGKEVQKFNDAMATRKSFISMIQNSNVLKSNLIKDELRMIPQHIKPKMQLVHIKVPERITPAKKKKQGDIRQALLTKINDSDEKPPEESPFLDPEQMAQVEKEFGSTAIKFDTLNFSKPTYLFHRINDEPMEPDELFDPAFTQQSEYNDWNRVLHQTYLVLHSTDTEALCHILHKSESMMLNTHVDLNTQQINCSNLIPQKKGEKKKSKTKNYNIEKKKKKENEEKQGRDIRECLAQVAEKVRLTQKKLVEDNERGRAEKVNVDLKRLGHLEEEILQMLPDPIILDESDTIIEDTAKEVKNANNIELKESDCLLCDKAFSLGCSIISKRKTKTANLMLNFKNLTKLELSLQKFSKNAINNITISKMFDESTNISNNIKNSLQLLKDKVNFSSTKRISSPLISVDDIFDGESRSPVLYSNILDHPKKQDKESKNTLSNVQEQDFFNLEDLFNEDDDELGFQSLVKNTKTSTPLKANCTTEKGLKSSLNLFERDSNAQFLEKQGEKKQQNNLINVNDKPIPKLGEHISPITKISTNPVKPVFKIPQMKLNFVAMSSPKSADGVSKINISSTSTPGSPILSGQTSVPQNTTYSPVLSGQVTQNNDSLLSPVLSGQVNLSQNNQSPILSGQVISSLKLERKVLFKGSSSEVDQKENSDWYKPLDSAIRHSDKDMAEIDALNLLSASQLFDDSSEEEKKELDQSSMYTISQMVAKVSDLADKVKDSTPIHEQSNQNLRPMKASSNIHFESSEEDSIFDQINLDDFSGQKDSVKPKINLIKSNNFDSSFKPTNHSSAIKNKINNISEIEKKEIEKINQLKLTNVYLNTSPKNDRENPNVKELTQRDEESFISSRWLTCMKTPLQNLQPKKSVSFASIKDIPEDSDSDSDVFENKDQKLKPKIVTDLDEQRKKVRKPKKKKFKDQFVEMEADVSITGGFECSSDEENTSGLDEMDESFINDFSEMPSTSVDVTNDDIHAKYLQSVKSPNRIPGFKIPKLTDSILARDVFSQVVPEDENDSYENDSFCCDATEIPEEDEPSELEIAERLLKQKSKKRKRKRFRPDSSSEELSGDLNEVIKKKTLFSSSSSNEDLVNNVQRVEKRKHLSSSDSSPFALKSKKIQKKKKRRVHLLTSSDSDSDKTIL